MKITVKDIQQSAREPKDSDPFIVKKFNQKNAKEGKTLHQH